MKKIIILAVFAILLMVLVSCEKEPKPGPPPVTYPISTTIVGKGLVEPDKLSGVILGGSVDFKFIPDAGYSVYSVEVNGIKVEEIVPSSTEVRYTVRDIKAHTIVKVTFVETGLLTVSVKSTQEQPWKWIKFDIYKASDNTFIRSSELVQSEKDERIYFIYPSMELIVLNPDNSLYFKGTWNLKQNVFYRASEVMSIWEISKTKIVIAAIPIWSNADNCYAFAVYTYERK